MRRCFHEDSGKCLFDFLLPLIVVTLMLLASCGTKRQVELVQPMASVAEHSSTVFLVMYDSTVGKEPLLKAVEEYRCEIVYDYHTINGMALKKPDDKTLEETMQYFRGVKGVLTVEYDHIYRLTDPVKPQLEIK